MLIACLGIHSVHVDGHCTLTVANLLRAPQSEVGQLTSQRDSLAAEVQASTAACRAVQLQAATAQREFDSVSQDLERAALRLRSLEQAQQAEQEKYERERAAAAQSLERERERQRQLLQVGLHTRQSHCFRLPGLLWTDIACTLPSCLLMAPTFPLH